MNTNNHDPNATIPNLANEDPYRMSFAELAVQLSITQAGSPRAEEMEREIKRRLMAEQSGLMRYQLVIGLVIGALVAMMSFSMGVAVSRAVPPHDHRAEAPTSSLSSLPPPFRRS